jgi:hypothetical protein
MFRIQRSSGNPTLEALLKEHGHRWMEPSEQELLPMGVTRISRPVWLYLSLVADVRRLPRANGLSVLSHMQELRRAFAGIGIGDSQ